MTANFETAPRQRHLPAPPPFCSDDICATSRPKFGKQWQTKLANPDPDPSPAMHAKWRVRGTKNVSFNLRLVDVNTTNLKGQEKEEGGSMWAMGWRCHFIDCVARKSVSPADDVLRMCRERALLKIGQAKFTNGRRNKATWTWTWPERSQTLQRVVVWSVPLAGDKYHNSYSTNKPSTTTTTTSGNNNNK